MVTLTAELDAAESCVRKVREIVHGMDVCDDQRTRVSLSCLGIAQDHHYAIVLCVRHKAVSSSLALVRALFEAYIRGAWLAYVACDDQVKGFINGEEPPRVGDLIRMLENSDRFRGHTLSRIKNDRWRAMCAYAHTSDLALQRYNTDEDVGPAHTDEEISEVLRFSNFFGIIAAVSCTEFVRSHERTKALMQLFRDIWPADVE